MNISIVIPNYNGKDYLIKCLISIQNHVRNDAEIIVIDNGSAELNWTDIANQFPEIKITLLDRNYGFSRAVNEGIKQSTGKYVVLLNNDVEVTANWLDNLVSLMEKEPKAFSASSKMLRFHERQLIDDAGDLYNILGWANKRGDGRSIVHYTNDDRIFSSCAGAAIYRRVVFNEIGLFDENYFAYLEDVDICFRAKIAGYANFFCSKAIVYHVGSGTSGSKYNEFKIRLAARNNVYLAMKNMPALMLIVNTPFLALGMGIKWVYFHKKGYGGIYKEGILEAFKTLERLDKPKAKVENLFHYLEIELHLCTNVIKYILEKLQMRLEKGKSQC